MDIYYLITLFTERLTTGAIRNDKMQHSRGDDFLGHEIDTEIMNKPIGARDSADSLDKCLGGKLPKASLRGNISFVRTFTNATQLESWVAGGGCAADLRYLTQVALAGGRVALHFEGHGDIGAQKLTGETLWLNFNLQTRTATVGKGLAAKLDVGKIMEMLGNIYAQELLLLQERKLQENSDVRQERPLIPAALRQPKLDMSDLQRNINPAHFSIHLRSCMMGAPYIEKPPSNRFPDPNELELPQWEKAASARLSACFMKGWNAGGILDPSVPPVLSLTASIPILKRPRHIRGKREEPMEGGFILIACFLLGETNQEIMKNWPDNPDIPWAAQLIKKVKKAFSALKDSKLPLYKTITYLPSQASTAPPIILKRPFTPAGLSKHETVYWSPDHDDKGIYNQVVLLRNFEHVIDPCIEHFFGKILWWEKWREYGWASPLGWSFKNWGPEYIDDYSDWFKFEPLVLWLMDLYCICKIIPRENTRGQIKCLTAHERAEAWVKARNEMFEIYKVALVTTLYSDDSENPFQLLDNAARYNLNNRGIEHMVQYFEHLERSFQQEEDLLVRRFNQQFNSSQYQSAFQSMTESHNQTKKCFKEEQILPALRNVRELHERLFGAATYHSFYAMQLGINKILPEGPPNWMHQENLAATRFPETIWG